MGYKDNEDLATENLLEMKKELTAEVIDDSEEYLNWFFINGPDLITEVLDRRKAMDDDAKN